MVLQWVVFVWEKTTQRKREEETRKNKKELKVIKK